MQMSAQQHHLTQIQILTLIHIQIQIQKHHLRSSSPLPGKLLLGENSFDEKNETSRKNPHASCDTSFSCRHRTQISFLFEILTHASLARNFCSICRFCLRNDCANALTCFQLPYRTISNEVTWIIALVATVFFHGGVS